jgi:hypothetical protein
MGEDAVNGGLEEIALEKATTATGAKELSGRTSLRVATTVNNFLFLNHTFQSRKPSKIASYSVRSASFVPCPAGKRAIANN